MLSLLRPTFQFRALSPAGASVRSFAKKPVKPLRAKKFNPYADSVRLPQTDFNQRANAKVREPEIQSLWSSLPSKLSSLRQNSPPFTLHDGPPYANGDLHIGHALNKILKDFLNRYNLLLGKNVNYVPGWDTHGLPIELKVLQSMKSSERSKLTPVTLREKAADFAKETVEKQSKSFQRYGIYGDFKSPYLTLQPEFESAQIRVFGEMYLSGHLYRGRKPVHWSPSSRTALAEAELEYPSGHVSKSVYVKFNLIPNDFFEDDVGVAVWTTTPWTMPANLAVAVNVDLVYVLAESEGTGKVVIAEDLVESLGGKFGTEFKVLKSFKGSEIVGLKYIHPFYSRESPILAGGDYITTDSGTGLVHTAPGHGAEDYLTGLKAGLECLSPVDDGGKFTEEAGERFVGLDVLKEGNSECISALEEKGALIMVEDYGHKYPYDWRTKKPTIFRATSQWFCSVEGFKDEAMDAISSVKWVPEVGRNRIESFVVGRNDWCISRQRSWGVPIPVFYDSSGEEVLITEETLAHIEGIFKEQGSDAWWKLSVEELLPDSLKADADKWTKGTDTMDVWFDSGSSWAGVLESRPELHYPADVYLEGSDQHRGWFQSSLLTSVAARNKAPYKTVITHGFVLDEKGYKMSKSLGNVVSPMEVIEGGNNQKQKPAYGVDLLRLWVASVDYSGDVRVGDGILKQTFESYRKLRNTARYMIGNLDDFEESNKVNYEDLPSLDKHILGVLSEVMKEVKEGYDTYDFSKVVQALLRFCTADLSNFYLDVAKDRLYISEADDFRRRSAQTVIAEVLEGVTLALAPLLPHMAEDINLNLQKGDDETKKSSVFEKTWPTRLEEFGAHDEELWTLIRNIRDDANQVMEKARRDKLIGSSMEAQIQIGVDDPATKTKLEALLSDEHNVDELKFVFLISQVKLVDAASIEDGEYVIKGDASSSKLTVKVEKAAGVKCERCWFFDETVGSGCQDDLCDRCDKIITNMGFVKPKMPEAETV
ncbi:hypothetical protein TrVE_jg12475 [Triparma verrucosa]|uniref:isoleucine--tRNA ligase n=1 Tax=Triparma verrucosa TaxID=1606542 RepID=A0A9W7BBJ7_9STRA|nr:hypothetical protein TrVE_jg12475 [Triparma verrucosa]